MCERHPPRVEEHPPQPSARERAVPREIAVFAVARERVPEMGEVYANLMRAPRLELGLEQRERRVVRRPGALAPEYRDRRPPPLLDAHAPLAFARRELVQRHVDDAFRMRPRAAHEHEVALVDFAVAELPVQLGERRALLRDQQDARRLAVEAMDELEKARLRPRGAQLLDEAERDPAAAVHGEAGRLVDGD